MTTQPRGLSTPGYQPSPSQPIPNRYSHPPPLFGSGGQAYSPRHAVPSSSPYQQQYVHQAGIAGSAHDPRHVVPSSSPYQQQYYQQAGIAGNAHDMYKGPGVVGTGTPPMMQSQQQYYNGGHRPRGPIPGARGMYYHTVLQRYPNIQGQTSPAQYQQYSNQQKPEDDVLAPIRKLAIREENTMIARVQLANMKQDREEPVRNFGARIRGQAGVCKFLLKCPSCSTDVNYTEEIIRDVLTRGISDSDIQSDLLADSNRDMTVEQVLKFVETKESGKRSASHLFDPQGAESLSTYRRTRKEASRSKPMQTSRDHGKGRSPYPGPAPRIIQKVVSIDRDVQLKTTENAWKPIKRGKNLTTKIAREELEIWEVIRDVRAILNKVMPNTFAVLMKKVLSLKIDTERKLRVTVDLIFEKAINESNLSEVYAKMCHIMCSIRVPPDEASGAAAEQMLVFRKLLLTKCQKEFENKSDQENLLKLKKKMEANTNKEIALQLQEEYELAETRERRRRLGNIRFIGELYKLRMLTANVMHGCIMDLFKARDDDHLESLCRLLTAIGKDLDHQKEKQRMDQYFEQFKKIIQEKRTSSRVRFMLQDVYDLRLNDWVPRAITTQDPKTISQIRQDAKQEQEVLQLKFATTAAPAMKQGGRQQNRMGSRGHGEDGWTKVQTPAKPTRYDPTKMKLNQFDDIKITMGPSRVYGAGWKSGSAGSGLSKTGSDGYSPSGSMDKTQETGRSNTPTSMKNRFSALSQAQGQASDYDNTRRSGGRQSSREGSRTGSRGSMCPPSSGSVGRTPHKDERSSVLEAARRLTSTERNYESRPKSSRESSPSVKSRTSTPRPQQTTHKYKVEIDEEKMQQKSKNILVEFLSIVDFKEATECIEELNAPPSLMHALVHIAHEFTLEKKSEDRTNIGRFMAHLLKLGRLSVEQYVKGLANLLEMATDYEIDVPMVWEYIAEQMSPVFEDDNEEDVPLSCLAELAAPLSDEDKSGTFVAEVVRAVIKRDTLEVFAQRWQKSNMLWSKIIGKSDEFVEAFLAQHNLSELSDSKGSPRGQGGATGQGTSGVLAVDEQYRLEQEITKLLEDGLSNKDIFIWVEKNVPLVNVTEPPFIRALMIAVCRKAMDAECKNVVEDRISERGIVLKKYIDSDPERELQAVYALQHMMVILDQPANVLQKIFDVLYNEDVITEQTFYKWEKCNDPNEQEGRGVAVASVNPFFTWLRTAEPESD